MEKKRIKAYEVKVDDVDLRIKVVYAISKLNPGSWAQIQVGDRDFVVPWDVIFSIYGRPVPKLNSYADFFSLRYEDGKSEAYLGSSWKGKDEWEEKHPGLLLAITSSYQRDGKKYWKTSPVPIGELLDITLICQEEAQRIVKEADIKTGTERVENAQRQLEEAEVRLRALGKEE